jgi:hypothetical protein
MPACSATSPIVNVASLKISLDLKPGSSVRLALVIDRPDTESELPIACTLDAGDLESREAEWAAVGSRLISIERSASGSAVLSFAAGAETKAELERLVAAEAECCPFLELSVVDGESLELTIDGPTEAAPVIDQLVDSLNVKARS